MAAHVRRIRLLGRIAIEIDGVAVDDPDLGRLGRAALAVLVLSRDRPISREVLADALWGDGLPRTWQPALRNVLSRVRTLLDDAGLDADTALVSGPAGEQLVLPDDVTVDVDVAAGLVERAAAALAAGDVRPATVAADEAVVLLGEGFGGAPATPFFDEQGQRVRSLHGRALDVLTAGRRRAGDHAGAVAAAETALVLEPWRETAYAELIRAYLAADDPGSAAWALERCRMALDEHLAVAPSPATLALLDAPRPLPAGLSRPVRLVGRAEPLQTLEEGFERARRATATTFFVGGDAGIGKTSLAAALARRLESEALVLYGRCDETRTVSFEPFVAALENGPDPGPLQRSTGDDTTPAEPGPALWRLLDDVVDHLDHLGRDRPVLLVLDDMQWADESSIALLRHLVRDPGRGRRLVLCLYRDGEVRAGAPFGTLLAQARTEPSVTVLRLAGLGPDEVADLAEASDVPISPELLHELHRTTAGNPYHVTEYLRLVGVANPSLPELRGVGGLDGVLHRRLDYLPGPTRSLLDVAAVIGFEFDLPLVASAAAVETTTALGQLGPLVDDAFVVPLAGPTVRFQFCHALMRDAVMAAINPGALPALHRRVAHAMAGLPGSDPSAVAYHLGATGDAADAAEAGRWWRRAAAGATTRLGFDEAALHLGRALEAADTLPPAERADLLTELGRATWSAGRNGSDLFRQALRLARELGDGVRMARAALGLATATPYSHTGPDPEVLEALDVALVALPDDAVGVRGQVQARRCLELTLGTDLDAPRTDALAALDGARDAGDGVAQATALLALGGLLWHPAEAATALEYLDEAVMVARDHGLHELRLLAHQHRLLLRLESGDRRGAEADQRALDALVPLVGRSPLLWRVDAMRSLIALVDGRHEDAVALGIQTISAAADSNERTWAYAAGSTHVLFSRWHTGEVAYLADLIIPAMEVFAAGEPAVRCLMPVTLAEIGRDDEGRALYEELRDAGFVLPHNPTYPAGLAAMATAAERFGDPVGAATLYDLLADWSGSVIVRNASFTFGGPVDWYLGFLARMVGRFDEAVAHLTHAIETSDALGAPSYRAFALFDLALALHGAGAPQAETDPVAKDALAAAEHLGMTPLARRCRAFLQT